METAIAVLGSVVVGYLLGSIPWAYLVARQRGVDIEAVGTGIAGAANVYRNVGHAEGIAVFVLDGGKGAATVYAAHLLGADGSMALPAVAATVAAHVFPVVGRFPGGIGLAALCGGVAALGGWVGLVATGVGALMLVVLRNTGRAAGCGFTAYVILGFLSGLEWTTIVGVLALGVATIVISKIRERRREKTAHR